MAIAIIKELFVNACILVTIVFVGSQLFIRTGVGSNTSIKVKIVAGLIGALLGIVLMLFSIKIPPYTIIDLRNTALMIMAIYAGGIATFISGLIIALFRLLYLGISNTSIFAASIAMVLTISFTIISKLKLSRIGKWVFMYLLTGVVVGLSFSLTVTDPENLNPIIFSYWIGTLLATVLAYYLTNYLFNIYHLFNRLAKESSVDFLTGLKNTRSFDILFNTALENAVEFNEKIAVLMVDIDFFKKVNDTYGHTVGDYVLQELGGLLVKNVRDFDIAARVGGEEFCLVLRNCPLEQALNIAQRVRRMVENHTFTPEADTEIKITISIGCAVYPDTVTEINNVKEAADMKLYEAKRSGRNRVCS